MRWWEGLSNVVKDIIVTTASRECMSDDIIEAAETMKKVNGISLRLETFVQEGAAHNGIFGIRQVDPT